MNATQRNSFGYGFVPESGRKSFLPSGTGREFSDFRRSVYKVDAARTADFLEEDKLRVLEKKIERAKRENVLMKALYESDKALALTDYRARASDLNNRIASTFFKPLYMDQISRYENLNKSERKTEPSASHLNYSKLRPENFANTPQRNFFGSQPGANQGYLKPASFVEGSKNILDMSQPSKSRINTEVRGNSRISNKSDKTKKANKSTVSKKKSEKPKSSKSTKSANKSTISRSKSRISKKSNLSQDRKTSKPLTFANIENRATSSKVSKKSKVKKGENSKSKLSKSKLSKSKISLKSKGKGKELSKSKVSAKGKNQSILNSLDKSGKLSLLKMLQGAGKTGWPYSALSTK